MVQQVVSGMGRRNADGTPLNVAEKVLQKLCGEILAVVDPFVIPHKLLARHLLLHLQPPAPFSASDCLTLPHGVMWRTCCDEMAISGASSYMSDDSVNRQEEMEKAQATIDLAAMF